MLHKIKAVEYLEGYKLKLWFDNDCIKIADLENKLKNAKNMFLPLQEKSFFKQVFLDEEAETIC